MCEYLLRRSCSVIAEEGKGFEITVIVLFVHASVAKRAVACLLHSFIHFKHQKKDLINVQKV